MIVNSLNKSINQIDSLLDGWTFGRLVVELDGAYLQLETGEIIHIPAGATLEVKNGVDVWVHVSDGMRQAETREGWPAYAGLEARMK